MKHQVAFTDPAGSMPAFVNLHETDDGNIAICVRARGEAFASKIIVTKDVFRRLHSEAGEKLV